MKLKEQDFERYSIVVPGMTRYRALFEFVARNGDELAFQPGDVILVPDDHNAEPGWLAGKLRDATGWFPESYVEKLDDPSIGNVAAVEAEQRKPLEYVFVYKFIFLFD